MRQRQRHLLRRCEPVFAVENHRVRDVEQQHGRARAAILRLVHHEVGVFEIERHPRTLARERVLQRAGNVEVHGVAELVGPGRGTRLDAGVQVRRVVRAVARVADGRQQMTQRAVAEEVDALLRQVELDLLRRLPALVDHAATLRHLDVAARQQRRIAQIDVAFLDELLHQVIEQLGDLLAHLRVTIALATQLAEHLGRELAALDERLQQRFLQRIERAIFVVAGPAPPRVKMGAALEAALQQEIGESLEQVLDVERVEDRAAVLRIGRELHEPPSVTGKARVLPGAQVRALRRSLLAWFDERRRDLPWRRATDPYHIWVSEVMLQQTRVETVIPYYERWLARFPTINALASAATDDVLHAWQGLGYYSRARNLQRAARVVREVHGGQLPADPRRTAGTAGRGAVHGGCARVDRAWVAGAGGGRECAAGAVSSAWFRRRYSRPRSSRLLRSSSLRNVRVRSTRRSWRWAHACARRGIPRVESVL